MPKSDQEVFEHFRSDYGSGLGIEVALLAYARYAQAKFQWVDHKLTIDGHPPTEDEVAKWIRELANPRLVEIHKGAIDFFKDAAEAYMKTRIDEERAKAVEQSILNRVDTMAQRVERASSSWRTFLPNVAASVVASFVFAMIVIFGFAIYRGEGVFDLFKEAPTHQSGGGSAR